MIKKYFRREIKEIHEESVEYIRKCPICGIDLFFSDFLSTNLKKNVDITEKGVWSDNRIAIPCCRCLKILEKIEHADRIQVFHNTDFELYHIKLLYNSIFEDSEIITITEGEIVRNLKKFGIIE